MVIVVNIIVRRSALIEYTYDYNKSIIDIKILL